MRMEYFCIMSKIFRVILNGQVNPEKQIGQNREKGRYNPSTGQNAKGRWSGQATR
jgi:hypothetical protein